MSLAGLQAEVVNSPEAQDLDRSCRRTGRPAGKLLYGSPTGGDANEISGHALQLVVHGWYYHAARTANGERAGARVPSGRGLWRRYPTISLKILAASPSASSGSTVCLIEPRPGPRSRVVYRERSGKRRTGQNSGHLKGLSLPN